ncbi:hypothetical protein BU17DRAFT_57765 [Hysterangium stoloniferum]|nr:hypothetical protein BU17DRAFT_57765 [Hysterangium stoloniferum]
MPWLPEVLRQFEQIPPTPSETDFHAPYNKLLNLLFPPDTEFTVVPQYFPGPSEPVNFFVLYEVFLEDKPVFILQLKPPGHLRYASTREAADKQIRSRLPDLYADCPLPVSHAVSAMGTQLCFYKVCNRVIVPRSIPAHPDQLTDTAPRARWSCDILQDEGEQRFQAVVDEIKQCCAAL